MLSKMSIRHEDETESAHNSKRTIRLALGTTLLILGVLIINSSIHSLTDDKIRAITPRGIINLEVAKNASERTTGLMYRKQIPDNEGMVFMFDASGDAGCFWMKNTYIPLDIIWLDNDKKVIYVHKNATTLSETPICPASNGKYVIEINAGRAEQLGLELGTRVRF